MGNKKKNSGSRGFGRLLRFSPAFCVRMQLIDNTSCRQIFQLIAAIHLGCDRGVFVIANNPIVARAIFDVSKADKVSK